MKRRSRAPENPGAPRATMTVEETARYLGVSRQSAYTLNSRGKLPTLRVGKRILVVRARLEAMLADGTLGIDDPWAT
jgi:excisionase family DNA binding protein